MVEEEQSDRGVCGYSTTYAMIHTIANASPEWRQSESDRTVSRPSPDANASFNSAITLKFLRLEDNAHPHFAYLLT